MSPRDAGNRNASAPDVREAARLLKRVRKYVSVERARASLYDNEDCGEVNAAHRLGAEIDAFLRAALASPVAAPVSPPAASRDAVAEVLLKEAHFDLRALPLPAAPAHDAVRDATERVVNAWRRMDAHGSDAELRRAVDALYEAWTDAAERAQRDAGASGDQRAQDAKGGDRG